MDRLWANVARSQKSDSSKATNPAEIVMDPRHGVTQGPGTSLGLVMGSLVPDFIADSTQGKIDFHRWIGEPTFFFLFQYPILGDHWALLFSCPQDFHPVSTTELAELAKFRREFEKRSSERYILLLIGGLER